MKTRMLLKVSLPALLVAGATVAVASAGEGVADAKAAAKVAAKAERALGKRAGADAVAWAEQAVTLSPQDAGHRALLGQAYLQAGRFRSAREAFADALQLDGRNGRVALGLVLAQIATGDWSAARATLDEHAGKISASDRGLAVALTGDPASAVAMLTDAARRPDASPKTRQNLALSLALAGQWQMARVVAAADMSPADVDARMVEWAAFAQPRDASDQVAHLLGVKAVEDAGRPAALALNAAPAVVPTVEPVAVAAAAAPVVVAPEPTAEAVRAPGFGKVVFGPRQEIVQALPAPTIRPARGLVKVALTARPQPLPVVAKAAPAPAPAAAPAKGGWFVQLGAYDSPAVAREAWGRAQRRFAALEDHTPSGMNFAARGRDFYRLSVGGFAHSDAQGFCRRYRAAGGSCFVRQVAGDQVAQWLRKPGVQVAAR
ncbi:SPOR domain-containing protein [Sphingomonas lenta]|uniref:SPOR domain-containing protein n=1 Tax=Sphingomonas lenta TaxID=1141887 RepID=A0A2A2SC72_9SPHN|nr:SPOR domain-containing protein [Sphingomonas lenta]PAX06813.1 SPOR domain-containing protein [Sphingomonas lenta]